MVKNKIVHAALAALAIASVSAAASTCPSVASSSYIELGLGSSINGVKALTGTSSQSDLLGFVKAADDLGAAGQKITTLVDALSPLSSKNKNGFVAALNFGTLYRPQTSVFCFGFLLGGAVGGGKSKLSYAAQNAQQAIVAAHGGDIFINNKDTAVLNVRDRGHLKAAFRVGVAAGSVMPFLQFGVATHRLIFKWDGANKGKSKWDNRLVLGGGIDWNATQNLIVGLLVERHIGGTRQVKAPFPVNTLMLGTPQMHARNTLIMFTTKYAFPRAQ